ncbi:MAG: DEAD/DEAH box helicase [Tepidiformaceae bacterium]
MPARPAQGRPAYNNGAPKPAYRPNQERRGPARFAQEPRQEQRQAPLPPAPHSDFPPLGVDQDIADILARNGITAPTPIQALAIADALSGVDICGKARTGSGKTLAFGIPMIQKAERAHPGFPTAVVLVPTRELATQILNAIDPLARARRLRTLAIFGGVSLGRQISMLRSGVDIVIATPGRLNDLLQRGDVAMDDVTMVVLDEADQMADMGFLPQVERILSQVKGEHQTLLFSATLDGDVDRLVKRYQKDPVFHEAASEEDENVAMEHRFIGVETAQKVAVAAAISAGPERTLLFVRTQRDAQRLVIRLEAEGVRAGMLHGGLSQPRRESSLRDFSQGRIPVLVATNIAARGIHVDDIETVVHFDPPEDSKTYLHRSGRTARAGASGIVVTLVSPEQSRHVSMLKRETGVKEATVAMNADDPRLADLAGWTPPIDENPSREQRAPGMSGGWRGPRNGGGGQGGGQRRQWGGRPRHNGQGQGQPQGDRSFR